jgi:hypothetical protein
MKRKKKPKIPPDPYKTVKTSLKSVLIDFDTIQPEINKLVIKCNDIVVQTYQFIRLFILHKYHHKQQLLDVNDKFVLYALKTQGIRDNRGRKAKDSDLLIELKEFYDQEFQPLTKSEKFDLKNLSYLLSYIATQIATCYQNNITERYTQHLLRFINKTTVENKTERFRIKKAVINGTELPEYQEWFDAHKKNIIPKNIVKSLPYDLKAYPNKFLPCMIYMNSILEKDGHKLFQPQPLRSNIIPKYITIDTACLINLFARKGQKGKLLQSLKISQELIWRQLFRLDKRVFKSQKYTFIKYKLMALELVYHLSEMIWLVKNMEQDYQK